MDSCLFGCIFLKVMSNTTKQNSLKGDGAEALLMAELIVRGATVSVPFGHDQLYDLVVEHGKTNRLLKVQVKMRSKSYDGGRTYKFRGLQKYQEKVDIIAFLCEDTWYFWTKLKLRRYGNAADVVLKTKYNTPNNFKVFGV